MQGYFDAVIADILSPAGGSGKDSDRAAYPPVLLAVSGGIDSMCMADLVLHSHHDLDFAVAHCNFHLRGEESDSDTAFVKDWCSVNGVRIHVADFDTAAFASGKGMSIEMAARELRYGWFGSLCEDYGYAGVFVAHNANDNAETLLLNLLRGTGLRGLSGMGKVSFIPFRRSPASGDAPGQGIAGAACGRTGDGLSLSGREARLFRPLLDFTRKQIEGYVRARNIRYRYDSSNSDSSYRRNRIRNEVFPILEKINPSFIKTLNREAGYFAGAQSLLEELVQDVFPMSGTTGRSDTSVSEAGEEVRVAVGTLLSRGNWPYMLYMFMEKYGFNSASIASVEKLLKTAGRQGMTFSGKIFRSDTHILVTASSELIVRPLSALTSVVERAVSEPGFQEAGAQAGIGMPASGAARTMCRTEDRYAVVHDMMATMSEESDGRADVTGPGTYRLGNAVFTVEVKPVGMIKSLKCPRGTVMFDISGLPFPFVCRRWRTGDWLQPLGLHGRKKVSDLFTDLKFNAFSKKEAVILVRNVGDSHVMAVLGERIDDSLKVTSSSSEVAVITLMSDR